MKDALGNDIVFGEKYAVSERCTGGLVVTNIGTAVKITPHGKVTLQLIAGIVHNTPEPAQIPVSKPMKYSVLPGLLFKL